MQLKFWTNNAFDTISLHGDDGKAVSRWDVTPKEFQDFLDAAKTPSVIHDWDVQDQCGLDVQDFGEVVAIVDYTAGLTVEDDCQWDSRQDYYGVFAA